MVYRPENKLFTVGVGYKGKKLSRISGPFFMEKHLGRDDWITTEKFGKIQKEMYGKIYFTDMGIKADLKFICSY